MKTLKEYPYKVEAIIPQGHPLGMKTRESIRTTFHRSLEKARNEQGIYREAGMIARVVDRKTKEGI
jgi:hypothetical protein